MTLVFQLTCAHGVVVTGTTFALIVSMVGVGEVVFKLVI